ncbi:MAG: response regulator [Lewinellaceae bacterium]|nr:response regulator [Lewinellaceae bacterium]
MKVLIIEDENAAARRLEKLLSEVEPEAEVVQRLDSVEASVLWLKGNPQPDLILLDIHLADGASFEIFEHINITCPIIFTTAYDEYALQAFKVNAVDYLLKPIKTNELAAAIDKYKKVFAHTTPDYSGLLETLRRQEGNNFCAGCSSGSATASNWSKCRMPRTFIPKTRSLFSSPAAPASATPSTTPWTNWRACSIRVSFSASTGSLLSM